MGRTTVATRLPVTPAPNIDTRFVRVAGYKQRLNMKTVASFSTLAEAHVALTRLESAGVDAVIRDEFMVTASWLGSNAIGGAKIEVVEDDLAAAREILALPASEDGVLRCPHCGSSDTRVRVLSVFGAICILLKLPIPMTRAIIDCHRCKKTHDVALNGRSR